MPANGSKAESWKAPPGGLAGGSATVRRRRRCWTCAETEQMPGISDGERGTGRSVQITGASGNSSPRPAASRIELGRWASDSENTSGRSRWARGKGGQSPFAGAVRANGDCPPFPHDARHWAYRVRAVGGPRSPADRPARSRDPSAAIPGSARRARNGRNRARPSHRPRRAVPRSGGQ